MTLSRRSLSAALITLASLALIGAPAFAQAKPVRVYAASSVTDAMDEIGALYEKKGHPKPVLVYAASSVLAKQIEQGAPADFFISADEAWMDYVSVRKLIDPATRTSALSNTLVLVAPSDRPLSVKIGKGMDLLGALQGGKLAMGDPDSVPAGKYGKAALESLGVWSQVAGSVVRAENVRSALQFVQRGEASAGIVYRTDQIGVKDKVALVGEFPESSHPHISYPMAVVKSDNGAEAARFAAFVKSPEARAVFKRLGFIMQ